MRKPMDIHIHRLFHIKIVIVTNKHYNFALIITTTIQ